VIAFFKDFRKFDFPNFFISLTHDLL